MEAGQKRKADTEVANTCDKRTKVVFPDGRYPQVMTVPYSNKAFLTLLTQQHLDQEAMACAPKERPRHNAYQVDSARGQRDLGDMQQRQRRKVHWRAT